MPHLIIYPYKFKLEVCRSVSEYFISSAELFHLAELTYFLLQTYEELPIDPWDVTLFRQVYAVIAPV